MTDPTPLSPSSQAVLDALYMDELNGPQQLMARAHAAAVLRAAADQVEAVSIWDKSHAQTGVRWSTNRFRAIADELEAQ